jgi:hypothetical protein
VRSSEVTRSSDLGYDLVRSHESGGTNEH